MTDCPFCAIVAGTADATVLHWWTDALAIVPLNPVVDGHTLIIPKVHFAGATDEPLLAGLLLQRAARIAKPPCNYILSEGADATQTVMHAHLHIVPRAADGGLALPWNRTGGGVVTAAVRAEHGYSGYGHGCRCGVCRQAKAQRTRELRANWAARLRRQQALGRGGRNLVDGITHGYSGYQNFYCRCDVCTQAKAVRSHRRYTAPPTSHVGAGAAPSPASPG